MAVHPRHATAEAIESHEADGREACASHRGRATQLHGEDALVAKIQEYKKAIAAFLGALAPVWAIVEAADWSTKAGLEASIIPIVAGIVTALAPKNKQPAPPSAPISVAADVAAPKP